MSVSSGFRDVRSIPLNSGDGGRDALTKPPSNEIFPVGEGQLATAGELALYDTARDK